MAREHSRPDAALSTALAACASAREAYDTLSKRGGELEHAKKCAKEALNELNRQLSASQALASVGRGSPDDLERLREQIAIGRRELEDAEREVEGLPSAIAAIRTELDQRHTLLSELLRQQTADLRKHAIEKYEGGIQALRDALTIVAATDGLFFDDRSVVIPDVDQHHHLFQQLGPSEDVRAALAPLAPFYSERERSQNRLLR